ncbi:nitrilase-related carbon-nitrogen hydrolase [Streptomyces sp. SID13031]|uniref:nitrilase-related carbon-nitrogen hydrolase n=1 Tax=Streptomyces sp. SID13031 TaxID=2706046 RepID=UPI0013C66987|nr:nitrilase-related carbon-nitrogen hydrolase [Streptomyces sp. SID13031]NEA32981.1 nitrilase [Streptomyces sp. SID13031]
MASVVVAAVQAGSVLFDTPATLAKGEHFIREAAAGGARLVVLPEAFVGGYPKGVDFGVTVGSRTAEGRELFRRYREAAIAVPGPETAQLAELSGQLGVDLVIGVIERDGGTLYCTALFFTSAAGLVAKHRKLLPTAAERYLWGQGDGSTMPAVRSEYGVLGAAICWENYLPLFRQAMYAKGIDIWCAPTVDDRDQWQATMRHIALEGRCFVISANQYLTRADLPADVHPLQGDSPDTVLINGGSTIISPLGEILTGPARAGETVLLAELDLTDRDRSFLDFDPVGHYSRPDIFTLTVNESPQHTVTRTD